MRSILKCSIAALVVLLCVSCPVRAQFVAGSHEVSGNIGFSNLTGVDGNKHVAFGGAGVFNLTKWASIGGEYSYQMLGSSSTTITQYETDAILPNGIRATAGGTSGINVSAHINSYGAIYRASLTKSSRIVPYALVAGGGIAATEGTTYQGANVSFSQNGYYFGFGGGVSFYVRSSWGVRPEFRYERQHFMSTTVDGDSIPSSGENYALGTVSVFYQWGGK